MVDSSKEITNARDELLAMLHKEYEQAQKQLTELDSLVEQTNNEVGRLQQKNTIVTNRLHQIEASFEQVPRQDIRVAYNEAMDTRNRLLTMRGNQEKLQSDQQQVQHLVDVLGETLGRLEGMAPGTFGMDKRPGGTQEISLAGANIIRIIEAQETERQRLARQMHDGPAQSLTNFILQAEICQRLFDRNPDRAAEELNNLKTVASTTFQKVRDFIFNLRPMMLDDLGLIPTLRRYIDNFEEKTEITTNLHILGDERRLESHREVIMFRGIQELLTNAQNHAKASQITVTLDMGADVIVTTVEDNGQGFNPEHIFAESEDDHSENKALGIKTLRERIELLNGSMDVQSEEGKGTEITLRIPAGEPPRVD